MRLVGRPAPASACSGETLHRRIWSPGKLRGYCDALDKGSVQAVLEQARAAAGRDDAESAIQHLLQGISDAADRAGMSAKALGVRCTLP